MPIEALFYGLNDKFTVKLSEASETRRQDGGEQETARQVTRVWGRSPPRVLANFEMAGPGLTSI